MSSNDKDKDFIDVFLDFLEPYKQSKVRFLAVVICFCLLFIVGSFAAPHIIHFLQDSFPFSIEFFQLSPIDVLFNYFKIGFFFALFLTFPFSIYQFGKLKIDVENIEEKFNLLYLALIVLAILVVCIFLVAKFIFPFEIMFLYGMNFSVATFSSSLSAMVSTFIFNIFIVFMLALLPVIRNLIKKSLFFNYATLIQYRKPVMIYSAILTGLMALPLELIVLGLVFLIFFFWYKIIVNFSKKRD